MLYNVILAYYCLGCTLSQQKYANYILELLKGLVVQIQTRISCQVQLLKLGRQIFRQGDLAQFIAAQIYTLTTEAQV